AVNEKERPRRSGASRRSGGRPALARLATTTSGLAAALRARCADGRAAARGALARCLAARRLLAAGRRGLAARRLAARGLLASGRLLAATGALAAGALPARAGRGARRCGAASPSASRSTDLLDAFLFLRGLDQGSDERFALLVLWPITPEWVNLHTTLLVGDFLYDLAGL